MPHYPHKISVVLVLLTSGSIAQRYVFAVLGAIGMAITYGLKVNFHVAIVAMVNTTALQAADNASGHGAGHGAGGGGECVADVGNKTMAEEEQPQVVSTGGSEGGVEHSRLVSFLRGAYLLLRRRRFLKLCAYEWGGGGKEAAPPPLVDSLKYSSQVEKKPDIFPSNLCGRHH